MRNAVCFLKEIVRGGFLVLMRYDFIKQFRRCKAFKNGNFCLKIYKSRDLSREQIKFSAFS